MYHLVYIIYNHIIYKECLQINTKSDKRFGHLTKEIEMANKHTKRYNAFNYQRNNTTTYSFHFRFAEMKGNEPTMYWEGFGAI